MTLEFAHMQAWLFGFISAYNAYVENGIKNIMNGIDASLPAAMMAEWCPGNQDKTIAHGAPGLIWALKQQHQ